MEIGSKLDFRHHTFLQAIMTRGPLTDKSAMTMYKNLFRVNTDGGFVEFLGKINKQLEFVQMEIKKVMNQYDGKGFYGLINTLPSKEAKLGTKYSQAQILFFTAVVHAIAQESSASGYISSTAAINLRLDPQGESQSQATSSQIVPVKLSMQGKQEALSLLIADQFLSRNDDGRVGLGVKTFLELRTVFRNLEVPFCEVCNEAAIQAKLCSNEVCSGRIHMYCLPRLLQNRSQKPKCSGCGTLWSYPENQDNGTSEEGEDYVIPIATQVQESNSAPRSGKRSNSKFKRKALIIDDEEGEPPEGSEISRDYENSTPNVPLRTTRARTSRREISQA